MFGIEKRDAKASLPSRVMQSTEHNVIVLQNTVLHAYPLVLALQNVVLQRKH